MKEDAGDPLFVEMKKSATVPEAEPSKGPDRSLARRGRRRPVE